MKEVEPDAGGPRRPQRHPEEPRGRHIHDITSSGFQLDLDEREVEGVRVAHVVLGAGVAVVRLARSQGAGGVAGRAARAIRW
jgi:hypothetical protein